MKKNKPATDLQTIEVMGVEVLYLASPDDETPRTHLLERTCMNMDEIVADFEEVKGVMVLSWRNVLAQVDAKTRYSKLRVVTQVNGAWHD